MKVVLLNPPSEKFLFKEVDRCQIDSNDLISLTTRPPINLALLAAISEQLNIKTKIIDAPIEGITHNQLKKFINLWKPNWIVVNAAMATLDSDLFLIQNVKQKDIKTVIFGHAPSVHDEEIMKKNNNIDFAIRGEPEKTFLELLESHVPLNAIKGLTYRENNKIFRNPPRKFIENLDELPFPAHHLIKRELYRVPGSYEIFTTIQVARGCPYKCTFCSAGLLNGTKVRTRSINSLIKEIEFLMNTIHIQTFLFRADTFTYDKSWVLQLCSAILRNNLKISWFCNSRTDTLDHDMLIAMKQAGCKLICFGIESGNENTLKSIKKGIKKENILKIIQLTRKVGILAVASYIIGLPGDTIDSILETIKFSKKVDCDLVEFVPFSPVFGTNIMQHENPQLPPKVIKKLTQFAYIHFYIRLKIIIRSFYNFFIKSRFHNLPYQIMTSLKVIKRILKK